VRKKTGAGVEGQEREILFTAIQYRLYRIRGIIVMPNQPSVFWHRHVQEKLGYFRKI